MIGWRDALYGGLSADRPVREVQPARDPAASLDALYPQRTPVDLPPPPPAEIFEYEELEDMLPAMAGGTVWDYYLDPVFRRAMINNYGTAEAVIDRDLELRGYDQDKNTGVYEDPVEIARYAANAGFRGEELVISVAIALAESYGGMPYIVGDKGINHRTGEPYLNETYGPSVGLWQIRSLLFPTDIEEQIDYVRRYEDLFDPQFNAIAAKHLYDKGDGFHEWTTYDDGLHLKHMDRAREAVEILMEEGYVYPSGD